MIKHIVMWKFRNDLDITPLQIAEQMKLRLENLSGKIDGLNFIQVGININNSNSAFDAVLISEFKDVDALEAYICSPLHLPIRAFAKKHRVDRKVVDFEIL